ncbi:MAG TPA: M48 family metallopeptidase [Terriglobia bacterium]|nr:M48 family metallopeptidase [Terriglobia bacterium]
MKFARIATLGLIVAVVGAAPLARGEDKKKDMNEIGNRKVAHRAFISQEKEIAIGKQYSTEIDKTAKLITDPVIDEYVNRVAQNVARNSDLTIPLTVKVIDSPGINAFALPGGFLYVNSGLLQTADEEAQVAGVIAHEIAHVAARHWASQMTKQTIAQYAMIPLMFIPMGYAVYYGVMEAYMNGVPLMFLKFSRSDEAEADYLGLQYMVKAGYDPYTYVTIFSKVLDEERRDPGSVPKIFQDHPPTPDRMLQLDAEMKSFPKRDQYLVSTSEFDDVKARLNSVISNRKKEKHQEGPTLKKREATDQTATQPTDKKTKDSGSDAPPVLRRRD